MEKSQKSDKMQALESALRKIEKDFGKGSIMKLGEVPRGPACPQAKGAF